MNLKQLEKKLTQLTESELQHKMHPDRLSPRYSRIEKKEINGEELYIFKFDSLMQGRNICMNRESRFAPIPKHIHSVIELNYVYRGSFTQIINGNEVTLSCGDVCILDMNTTHEILPLSENDIVITIDMRKDYFMDSFLSRLSTQGLVSRFLVQALSENNSRSQYLLFRSHPSIDIHSIIQQLLYEYYDYRICSTEIMDSYMIILFSNLLRMYQKQAANDSCDKENNETLILMLKYLESNYKTVTLESAAKIFGYHPNYLSAYIKRCTGSSFKELIITQRMLQAGFELKNSAASVQDVAYGVGYHNLGFFYKKFEEHYHMSPLEYRNLNRLSGR